MDVVRHQPSLCLWSVLIHATTHQHDVGTILTPSSKQSNDSCNGFVRDVEVTVAGVVRAPLISEQSKRSIKVDEDCLSRVRLVSLVTH